jgi:hypothetical protein
MVGAHYSVLLNSAFQLRSQLGDLDVVLLGFCLNLGTKIITLLLQLVDLFLLLTKLGLETFLGASELSDP